MAVLEIKELKTGYKDRLLFQNLSFSINRPAFIAILGHNGSGKSTFLRTMTGKQPFQGKILLEGFDISTLSKSQIASRISYLQQKNSVNFSIPVKELVVMGKFRGKSLFETYEDSDYLEAQQALETLRIGNFAEQYFTELSGGEQQLVWLAQLILQQTPIWLLDEPTQQLDLYNKKKVFLLLKNLVENSGKIVFCVTHDVESLHYLSGHYMLNFSEKILKLESINEDSIKRNIKILENQNS